MKAVTLLDVFDFYLKIANCHDLFLSLFAFKHILMKPFCCNSRKGPDIISMLLSMGKKVVIGIWMEEEGHCDCHE